MDTDGSRFRWLIYSISSSQTTLYIVLIIFLVFFGAFFAASETAFSCCNKTRIRNKAEHGDKKAIIATYIFDHYDNSIVSMLIYINIAHILCSVLATILAISVLSNEDLATLWATVITTLVIFIFSETLPKNIAKVNADKFVLNNSGILKILMFIIYPLVLLFAVPFKFINKQEDEESEFSEEDLSTIVDSIEDEGVLDSDESDLIQNAIEFDDTKAKEIYTPIKNMVGIDAKLSRQDFIDVLLNENRYSRLPVYKDSIDNIVGVVYLRLALKELVKNKNVSISSLIHKPLFVKQGDSIDDILDKLMNARVHIAFVRDNNNKVIGFVTMDDILDELTETRGDDNE